MDDGQRFIRPNEDFPKLIEVAPHGMAFQTADVCNLADLLLVPIPQEIADAACNIYGAEAVFGVHKIRQPDQMRIVQHLIAEIVQSVNPLIREVNGNPQTGFLHKPALHGIDGLGMIAERVQ